MTAIHGIPARADWPPQLAAGARRATAQRVALEGLVAEAVAEEDFERALQLMAAAAQIAWLDHSGELVSPALEASLLEVALGVGPWPVRTSSQLRATGKVLHVLTEAYATGGHTRLCWRWIGRQEQVAHDVVLTGHSGPIPEPLTRAVTGSGGTVTMLTGSAVRRVMELRSAMAKADTVVLHIHPHDAVAAAAAVHPDRSVATVLLNHADHVFWIGATAADKVLCIRDAGRRAAISRRGVAPARTGVLPLPLGDVPTLTVRSAGSRQRTIITAASPYKFAPFQGVSLADLVSQYLDLDPTADFIAVGPMPGDPVWSDAVRRHGKRVELVGRVDDLGPYFARASVYVDSYPFASLTSWLDAGLHGLPVVAFRPPHAEGSTISGDDPGDAEVVTVRDPQAWMRAVASLLDDPQSALERGSRLRRDLVDHHADGWAARVEQVLRSLDAMPVGDRRLQPVTHVTQLADAAMAHLHRSTGQVPPVRQVLASHGLLDAIARVDPFSIPADLSVVLATAGGAAEVVEDLQAVLDACGHVGRLDIQCLDAGVDEDGLAVLQELEGEVRTLIAPAESDGIARAWGRCLQAATSPVVLILSNNVMPSRHVIDLCLRELPGVAEDSAVTPALRRDDGSSVPHGDLSSAQSAFFVVRRDAAVSGRWANAIVLDAVCGVRADR